MILSAPHYHPFTRALLETLEREKNNDQFIIYNIAGNGEVALTYRTEIGAPSLDGTQLITRDSEIRTYTESSPIRQDRLTVLVQVQDLPSVYKALAEKNIVIDHIYDY